jgi:hypothetical protein
VRRLEHRQAEREDSIMQRIRRRLATRVVISLSLAVAAPATAQVACQAIVADFVYEDANGNGRRDGPDRGIDGVSVQLFDDHENLLATTRTSEGAFSFSGLCARTYGVEVVDATLPLGFVPSVAGTGNDPDDGSDGATGRIVVSGPGAVETDIDFAYVSSATGCHGFIGDYVFEDVNANGVQDGPDASLGGVRIVLTDSDGNSRESISDRIDGFGFDELCAGDYTIEIDTRSVPAGFVATASNLGGNETMDSDGSPTRITLNSDDAFDPDIDFGFSLQIAECGMSIAARATPKVIDPPDPLDWICYDGHLVYFHYDLTNNGPDLQQVAILDDDRGGVGSFSQLLDGQSETHSSFGCVEASAVIHVTATGTLAGSDETCSASATATVTIPE